MHRPGTVECLYSANCAILPLRWMDVSCCPRRFPNADGDNHFSNGCLCTGTKCEGRATNLEPVQYGDDDVTCASLPEATSDKDAKVNLPTKKVSDYNSGECPRDPTVYCNDQEIASSVSDRDECLDWQEERKQWISAAGVSTPADLQRKIEDMGRAATQNEGDLKSLFRHIADVKTFLLQFHDIDEYLVKRKRRRDRPSRRRTRSGGQGAMDCCCAISEDQDSSTETAPKKGRGSLLDPEIMRCFGSLIKSSA